MDDHNQVAVALKTRQEGVKKTILPPEAYPSPDMLKSLRLGLSESLSEFGLRLKRAIDPRTDQGFSRQYIYRLEKGQDVVTQEIAGAFWHIAAALDDVPAGTGGSVLVKVLAAPGQVLEGAFIPRSAKVVKCANPGCAVVFIKTHPRQKYHDPECNRKNGHKVGEKVEG